jgi:hypothetical protein
MNRLMSLALILCVASSGRALGAQAETPTVSTHTAIPSAVALRLVDVRWGPLAMEPSASVAQPAQRGSSRDPLKNGAIIGAIAGAAGSAAFAAVICQLYQEEGGRSCLPDTLRFAAIGTAIGIGAGVTIDASLTRQPGVAVRIGVTF